MKWYGHVYALLTLALTASLGHGSTGIGDELPSSVLIGGREAAGESLLVGGNGEMQTLAIGDIISSLTAPNSPSGLTFDGTSLWMVSEQAGLAYRIDPASGNTVSTIQLPSFGLGDPNGYGIAYDGAYLWHSDYGSDRIYKLDPATGDTLMSFPFSSILGLTWDGQFLWGSDPSSDYIYQIDTNTGSTVNSFPAPTTHGIGLTFAYGFLWASDYDSPSIYKIDPTDGTLLDTFSGPESGHLGLAFDGQYLWVAGGSSLTLYHIDPGVAPTVISVPTDSLLATLFTGGKEVQNLRITNAGVNDLFFDLSIKWGVDTAAQTVQRPRNQPVLVNKEAASVSGNAFETVFQPLAAANFTGAIAVFGDYVSGPLSFLQGEGYNAVQVYESDILGGALSNYDLLAMVHHQTTLSSGVQQAIAAFVLGGGGLITEWSSSTLLFSSVGSNPYYVQSPQWGWFTGEIGYGSMVATGTPVDVIDPLHPLAAGLSDPFSGGGGTEYFYTLSGYSPELYVVAEYSGHGGTWPALMVGSYGSGAVVIHLFDSGDAMSYGDLQQLWRNSVQVAAEGGVNWLSVDPASGMVSPGTYMDVEVTLDATNRQGGHYFASIEVASNDTSQPVVSVPAHLTVIPAPDIEASHDTLEFNPTFVGYTDSIVVTLSNMGTDSLTVTGLAILNDNANVFSLEDGAFTLYPSESHDVVVLFTPGTAGVFTGTLSITSNDPDENPLQLSLSGEGQLAPAISVSPEALGAEVSKGDSTTLTITIDNSAGQGSLEWSAAIHEDGISQVVAASPPFAGRSKGTLSKEVTTFSPGRPLSDQLYINTSSGTEGQMMQASARTDRHHQPGNQPVVPAANNDQPSLETILERLNANNAAVTNAIPERFDFSDGITGNYISDGGNDMYDGGNYLSTDLGQAIYYSDNTIATDAAVGTNGRYFTRKYDGLFVFAADLDNVDYFEIGGNLGADGDGVVDGIVLESVVRGVSYTGYVKRVYDSWDPSVNHMIIVVNNGAADHEFATYTDNDYHRVTGLTGATRIYYLLYSSYDDYYEFGGQRINDHATQVIMSAFLEAAGLAPPWLALDPSSGTVGAGNSVDVNVNVHAVRQPGTYEADIVIMSNDPLKPEIAVPFGLHIPLLARPQIESITDVPGDQGGWLTATWWASSDDRPGSRTPVLFYSIWMKNAGSEGLLGKDISSNAASVFSYGQTLGNQLGVAAGSVPVISSFEDTDHVAGIAGMEAALAMDGWIGVGSLGATQDSLYQFLLPTLGDSNQAGPNWTYLVVSAHTAVEPSGWVPSVPDSGYSVDNIAPGVPQNLAAASVPNGTRLSWAYDIDAVEDFQYFAVYRGYSAGFQPPHQDSVFAATSNPYYVVESRTPAVTRYFRVAAVDNNGNYSESTEAVSEIVLATTEGQGIPEAFALRQNYPNPFNPSTTIRFDVPEATHLSLVVYDILGREVAQLKNAYVEPGYHSIVWDGKTTQGREVPTGVYILRLVSPAFTRHIKMVLMK
ncbi:MAG: choice-of-anchor D domain-containing protein [Fidelibacterota bacterium]|nr:MAG: choice-of-anchor D domain-containing protein [Candidatus Neomarinimicrobiota bacterium]